MSPDLRWCSAEASGSARGCASGRLDPVAVEDLPFEPGRVAGRINAVLERRVRIIGLHDVMIAASAVPQGLPMVTFSSGSARSMDGHARRLGCSMGWSPSRSRSRRP